MEDKAAQFNVTENGPVEVTGTFQIFDSGGNLLTEKGPVYLCRCGHSAKKPFCDGSHKKNGFTG